MCSKKYIVHTESVFEPKSSNSNVLTAIIRGFITKILKLYMRYIRLEFTKGNYCNNSGKIFVQLVLIHTNFMQFSKKILVLQRRSRASGSTLLT